MTGRGRIHGTGAAGAVGVGGATAENCGRPGRGRGSSNGTLLGSGTRPGQKWERAAVVVDAELQAAAWARCSWHT